MLVKKKNSLRIDYIHGRPSGLPIHTEYFKLLNADLHFKDYHLGWLYSIKLVKLKVFKLAY